MYFNIRSYILTFTASRVSILSGCEMAADEDPDDPALDPEGCGAKSRRGLLWAVSALAAETAAMAAAAAIDGHLTDVRKFQS